MAMNRFVRLEDLLVRQGVLAMVLLLPFIGLGQQVPDAPTPQGPDSLGTITSGVTPGKGAQAPQDQNPHPPQPPPGAGTQPAGQDQVQQAPPEVPPPGEMQKNITRFVTRVNY